MQRFAVVLLLVCGTATAQTTAPPVAKTRASWEWTAAERIGARTDVVKAAARVRAAGTGLPHSMQRKPSPRIVDVIDGSRNPELFLPVELFEMLVTRGYVGDTWRDDYDLRLASAGLPGNFWHRLETIDEQYIHDLRAEYEVLERGKSADESARSRIDEEVAGLTTTLCRERADALIAARNEFGVALDRFLYTVVAPGTAMYFEEPQNPAQLRSAERGCR